MGLVSNIGVSSSGTSGGASIIDRENYSDIVSSWILDFKTYGEESYVYIAKDIWHKVMTSYQAINDAKMRPYCFKYADENKDTVDIGELLSSMNDYGDVFSSVNTVSDIPKMLSSVVTKYKDDIKFKALLDSMISNIKSIQVTSTSSYNGLNYFIYGVVSGRDRSGYSNSNGVVTVYAARSGLSYTNINGSTSYLSSAFGDMNTVTDASNGRGRHDINDFVSGIATQSVTAVRYDSISVTNYTYSTYHTTICYIPVL